MALTVEVQWEDGDWADVTAIAEALNYAHGASANNPDRPTVASGAGTLVLDGVRDPAPDRRVAFRFRHGTTHTTGWMSNPQHLRRPARTQWQLQGRTHLPLRAPQAVNIATGTVGAAAGNDDLWTRLTGAPAQTNQLPSARNLLGISFTGQAGLFVSRFALIASAQPCATAAGAIRLANPHLTATPAGTTTVDSSTWRILDVTTAHRQDQIRNIITIRTPAVHMDTEVDFTANGSVRNPPPALWSATQAYARGSLVTFAGTSWRARRAISANAQGNPAPATTGAGALDWEAHSMPQVGGSLVLQDPQPVDGIFTVPEVQGATYQDWMVEATAAYLVGGSWFWYLAGQFYNRAVTPPRSQYTMRGSPTQVTLPVAAANITPSFVGLAGDAGTVRASVATGTPEQWTADFNVGVNSNTPANLQVIYTNPNNTSGLRPFAYLPGTNGAWQATLTRHGELQAPPTGFTTWYPSRSFDVWTWGAFHNSQVTRIGPPAAVLAAMQTTLAATQRAAQAWALTAAFEISATRRVPNVIPARTAEVADTRSQARWGPRHLELPPWLANTTPAGVEDQLEGLAAERKVHTVILPLAQPAGIDAGAVDAGHYITLVAHDSNRGVDVNEVCLVISRRLQWSRHTIATLTWECLETGARPPLPVRPPTGLTATALTTTSIRVNWGNVPAGSQPATGWHTETRPTTSTGAWARVASDAAARTVDITGLSPSTDYDVRVRAVTAGGNSSWANTSVRTPTPEPAPGVPQNLSVSAVGTSAIDADWNAPNTGGTVTSYTLRWRPHGTGAAWSTRTGFSGRSGRITGLSASTDYEVQVRANGVGGSSAYSASARATTADPPAPGVPTNLAVAEGNAQLRVTWGDPADGGAAANYTIEWTAGGVGLTHTVAAGTNAYTITGLTNGVQYTVRVRASNAGGTSAWTAGATGTPEATRLHGPTFTRVATAGGNRYLQIQMDAYTPPAGHTAATGATVEVQRRVGTGDWSATTSLDRRHWANGRWQNWNDPAFPKEVRARIQLRDSSNTAVWSDWETTTFASATSAEPDRVFIPLEQDGRLIVLDDRLIGQENET